MGGEKRIIRELEVQSWSEAGAGVARATMPRWYQVYSVAVVAVTAVLIWWGAAVTTENVGLAVPDWPLSFGSVNPPNWWLVPGVRLEHGHRLLAALVGLLTLGLCAGAWMAGRDRALRIATGAAVILVILQGVLGGLRVLHVSDKFGIIHGCLGQTFFCLLLAILLMAHQWAGPRPVLAQEGRERLRLAATVLFAAVFIQLVLGATLRHTQRFYLADDGLLLTGDSWFPGFGQTDLLILFLHKWWAMVVAGLAAWGVLGPFRQAGRHRFLGMACRTFAAAVAVQVALGIGVILTGKSFWITNFHVVNGLLLLAASFLIMLFAWRSVAGSKPAGQDALPVLTCSR